MSQTPVSSFQLPVMGTAVTVSALWMEPASARLAYVLAHGAGAGMGHRFMEEMARRLASHGVATLRYQFSYIEEGRRRPDPPHLLEATVRSAVGIAAERATGLPLIAGGKSMGGRMTSSAAAQEPLPGVEALAFLGFPLHPPGKPGTRRADHLARVDLPMLFLQGTRDRLAELSLLEPVLKGLGGRATLHVVEGGDHSFAVPKRSGRTQEEVYDELARTIAEWGQTLTNRGGEATRSS